MASTVYSVSIWWPGGLGGFKLSPPEAESFYTYITKANFYRLYACFALELLSIKKILEFHIFKRSISFSQLTHTDLRSTFIIVPA